MKEIGTALSTIPARPYPGVESYGYSDRQVFVARENEARKLTALVTIYRSVLLYGLSGTGKSSLINAGVIPAVIEAGFSPTRIRVQPRPGEELVVERTSITGQSGPPYLPSVFASADDERSRIVCSIPRFRELLDTLNRDVYPLLIFDQFEEFISLFEEAPQGDALRVAKTVQGDLRNLLLDLIRDTSRSVKILFVFREDYLAKLGELFAAIPDQRDRYLRLAPPALGALHDIIRGPYVAFPGLFSPELSESLTRLLCDEFGARNETGVPNLSEVQLVCARLSQSSNPLNEFRARGLHGLLEDSLSDALRRLPTDLRDPAIALLGRMITDAGLRNVISRDDLLARAHREEGLGLGRLEEALEALVTSTRLVRKERRRDVLFFEIVSEFLVPWIGRQRVLRQQLRQRRRTRAIVGGVALFATIIAATLISSLTRRLEQAEQIIGSLTEDISFLTIVQEEDAASADIRLKRFLELAVANASKSQQAVGFSQQKTTSSGMIRALTEPGPRRPYLARIPAYVYVVAEMLGADLKILGIYKSAATGGTTYNSYFVVRRDALETYAGWKPDSGDPTLENVKTYIKQLASKKQPARFVYHDRFSTSSYFLPSLYFKSNQILAVDNRNNDSFIPIQVQLSTTTSTIELVNQVWRKDVELAAVWDGTKERFNEDSKDSERVQVSRDVAFIPIPSSLPNDFLVASGIGEVREAGIMQAIEVSPGAGRMCTSLEDSFVSRDEPSQKRTGCSELKETDRPRDDFDAWYVWDSSASAVTDAARVALARLREDALQRPMPVVVRVQRGRQSDVIQNALSPQYLEAVRDAIRLSGTEFVLEDPDLHVKVDMIWTLETTRDSTLLLNSSLVSSLGESVGSEVFSVSFVDRSDLTWRIANLIRSQIPRIRYVWPYEQAYPLVLRDFDFTPDERVLVQKVKWLDPKRNEYEEDRPFEARIEDNTNFSELRLSNEALFPRNADGSLNFDPMSDIQYRVIIGREQQAHWVWFVLPYCSLAALAIACVGVLVDLRRRNLRAHATRD